LSEENVAYIDGSAAQNQTMYGYYLVKEKKTFIICDECAERPPSEWRKNYEHKRY